MKTRHISVTLILLILLMIFIFCLSAQPADESTVTSGRFCRLAARILFSNFDTMKESTQKAVLSGLTHIVRKAAHFTEYTVMGFLWYLLLRKKKRNILISIAATALYAASDELHQRFVSGRSGQVSDVILDACGGCFGVMLAFVLLCIVYCCTDERIVKRGIWRK